MVRTKADAATRVAAGGKAPKKSMNRAHSTPSPNSGEKLGKDNLPVNRYCPRETPAWQKKITCFINKNPSVDECRTSPNGTIDNALSNGDSDNISPKKKVQSRSKSNGRSKRSSSEIEEDEDESCTNESTRKRRKTISDMETDIEHTNGADLNDSMDMDE